MCNNLHEYDEKFLSGKVSKKTCHFSGSSGAAYRVASRSDSSPVEIIGKGLQYSRICLLGPNVVSTMNLIG
jgi:hypothetical protein